MRNSSLAFWSPKQYVFPFSDFHMTEHSVGMCFFIANPMVQFF
jgi:hypothetical protein